MKHLITIILIMPVVINGSLLAYFLKLKSSSSRQLVKERGRIGGGGGGGVVKVIKTQVLTKIKKSKTPAPTKFKTPAPKKANKTK